MPSSQAIENLKVKDIAQRLGLGNAIAVTSIDGRLTGINLACNEVFLRQMAAQMKDNNS